MDDPATGLLEADWEQAEERTPAEASPRNPKPEVVGAQRRIPSVAPARARFPVAAR